MKKVYITGIAGLLGYAIATKLMGKYQVCGVDLVEVEIEDCNIEKFDLTDFEQLENSIRNQKPDILIHTAAAVNVDGCETNRDYANSLNSKLTENISFICKKYGIKLIYISTDAVFDGEKKGLYTEDDVPNPINYYGLTKLQGEDFVKQVDNSLTLRTNIYGVNIQNKKSFGEWIVSSLQENQELNMFTDIMFSPILVNELAEIIDICICNDIEGLYHACGTGSISKYEFGMLVKEIFGINTGKIHKTTSDTMEFIAKRSKNMGMSNKKLRERLNINISTPEESIRRFKELY
ncbi:MAG: SDR family oxidoreductase [Lachnospiraceae bacterium]|nr:SDR family oxidoreductase [Lachnospiraceae bacterium]